MSRDRKVNWIKLSAALLVSIAVSNHCFALLGGNAFDYPDRLRKEKMKLVPEDKRGDRDAEFKAFYPCYTNGWYDGMYIPTNTFQASGEDILKNVHVISEPDGDETFEFCGVVFGRPMSEQKGKSKSSGWSPNGRSNGIFMRLSEPLGRLCSAAYETGPNFVLEELDFSLRGESQEAFERILVETVAELELRYVKGRLKGWATAGCAWPFSALFFSIDRPKCKVTFSLTQALLEDHSKARGAKFKVRWEQKKTDEDKKSKDVLIQ